MSFRELKLPKNPECPVCGENPTVTELIDYQEFCGIRPQEEETSGEVKPDEITVQELEERLSRGDDNLQVVDVREPHEFEICALPNAKLIPLSELLERVNQLNSADDIVLYCHTGRRSMQALQVLKRFGFEKVKSLAGGIDAWAKDIDPTMPRY